MIMKTLSRALLAFGLLAVATPINAGGCSGGGWDVQCSGGICVACVSDGLGPNWCGNVTAAEAQRICSIIVLMN